MNFLLIVISVMFTFPAFAMNWNGKNAAAILDRADGRFRFESGHPLATYRAFSNVLRAAQIPVEESRVLTAEEQLLLKEAGVTATNPEQQRLEILELRKATLLFVDKFLMKSKQSRPTPIIKMGKSWEAQRLGLTLPAFDALQNITLGSWMNEINTNIDLTGGTRFSEMIQQISKNWNMLKEKGAENVEEENDYVLEPTWKARIGNYAMTSMYKRFLQGRQNSVRYSLATGYSSSNYLHCMAVDSRDTYAEITDQRTSAQAVLEHIHYSVAMAIANLVVGRRWEQELKVQYQKAGTDSGKRAQLNKIVGSLDKEVLEQLEEGMKSGYLYLGSVFHTLEDCSVTCAPGLQTRTGCLLGDGHTVWQKVGDQMKIATLSNGEIYDERAHPYHENLDDVYVNGQEKKAYIVDPSEVTGTLLADVLKAARIVYTQVKVNDYPLYNWQGGKLEYNMSFDERLFSLSMNAAAKIVENRIEPMFAKPEEMAPISILDAFKALKRFRHPL